MKKKLLLITAAALTITAAQSAQADNYVTPGERLIVDDRVDEAPQLKKQLFKKPKVVTKEQLENAPEPPPTNYDARPDDASDTSEADQDNNNVNVDVNVNTGYGRDADDIADEVEDIQDEINEIND